MSVPSPFLLAVASPSTPPSAVDVVRALWMLHMAVFVWSLLSVGHRVALPLHVWVITGGQHCSVLDPFTASQQLLEMAISHALYRCYVVSVLCLMFGCISV